MTGEEQSIISALVAAKQNSGLIGVVSAVALAVLGFLGRTVWTSIDERIKAAQAAAAAAEVNRRSDITVVHAKLDDHISRDAEMHGEMMKEMSAQTRLLGEIHANLRQAVGDRPTRQEVREMIEFRQQQRAGS